MKVTIGHLELASRLDANETVFFERELTHVMRRVYEREYAELEAFRLLPINREASEADDTILWHAFDAVGIAKFIANYADDLPRVDVYGEEHISPVRPIGAAYGYSVQDVRRSAKTGRRLEQRKANAARMAVDQQMNRVGFYGDSSRGLKGLFTTPNTNDVTAAAAAAAPNGTAWTATSGKTPDEILADLNDLVDSIPNATRGVHRATHLVIPADRHSYLKNTPRSAGSDKSILQWFQDANPDIVIEKSYEMQAVTSLPSGAAGTDHVAMAYAKDPDNLAMAIPMAFRQHPPQSRNLEFVVNTEARIGGVIVWRPLTISFMEGV
jgi:hypothetical protein